jgi:SAM-dependent methyltransferase
MTDLPEWPAAERNKEPILHVLQRVLPAQGLVLELASATGQHAEHFARALPRLTWQVSDYDPEHCATLAERVRRAGLSNLLPPVVIDATSEQWPVTQAAAVYCANMIHISPWEVTLGLFAGAGRVLQPGGLLVTYGPYSVDGQHISESNARFDESLKEKNPEWGVRDVIQVAEVAQQHGFVLEERVQMPANNFTLIWRRK